MKSVKPVLIDEILDHLPHLIRLRLPWLLLGLLIAFFSTIFVSRFEEVISKNISLAFFLPMIVYMSDAVGTQSETIFVRKLQMGKLDLKKYLLMEFQIGLFMGIILGVSIAGAAYLWLKSVPVAMTVGWAMFVNILIAPTIAVVIPEVLYKKHSDPALGAGPFSTVIQDTLSLVIYFLLAFFIIRN
ncbi:MAG: MgtE integral membrane protein, magnesium transporter [Candidatus Gottesmanbacteria bacterium GW2011_GWA2_43_14]|uniref:MgtE integral membrane protein, magnesium transporter n=1 Tax=Candidatus Gottesmanbacteria bacterium GW2011_GWA2_43_14 TaxID=1618443 RepID=A0A0G1DJB6_9BACT|nr:MAG: MgtE integral membrane protein, magnesium transporter [Candidatus Gottesmanbacteria bacterium GW2011_GWA2_43_14]